MKRTKKIAAVLEPAAPAVYLPEDYRQLNPVLDRIFRKYRIVSREKREGYTEVMLRKSRLPSGEPLGQGPLLSMQCLNHFVGADKTADKRWLDWMLFQVGGGKEGQRRSEQAMESAHGRFIEERVRGYRDHLGTFHEPVTEGEAKARWEKNQVRYLQVLAVADQDMVEKCRVFGFHRNWPGPDGIYEKAVQVVSRFQRLRRKFRAMNAFYTRAAQPDKCVGLEPDDYQAISALEDAIKKVERFFQSRLARKDTRLDLIYEDAYIQCFCPLTYAAAVRYGWDAWAWASRQTFEERLENSSTTTWNDPWVKLTKQDAQVLVYFNFKVAMPSWISFDDNKFSRASLENLALPLKASALRVVDIRTEKMFDEENRSLLTVEDVRKQIKEEPLRVCDPEKEEYPIHRGSNVYSQEESEAILQSFDQACRATVKWARQFNPARVVSNYLGQAA